jgi:hypothetical protein
VSVKAKEKAMPTQLLDDDGTASMATMLMCSHHAFRRDLASFAKALAAGKDSARLTAVAEEWTRFRGALHGHHTVEDTTMFPSLRKEHPEIAATIDVLSEQHHAIDPLLERGDKLFASLGDNLAGARDIVGALGDLLATHLDLEERTITPHLRAVKQFPAPPDEAMLAMYADGFAWSCAGIAESVLEKVFAMLPPALRSKIPAARDAFAARTRRVWGSDHTGATTTSVPALS